MQEISKRLLNDLRNVSYPLLLSLIPYAFGFVIIFFAGQVLKDYYPNPVIPQDLILDNINEYQIFVIVGELASVTSVLLLAYTAYKQHLKNLPEYFSRSSVNLILRSLTIILTPLASIQEPATNGSLPIFSGMYYGMFYSGHTAGAFLIFFLDNYSSKTRNLKFITACITATSLILSHSHYSIDIIGGILAAYAISKMPIPKVFENTGKSNLSK
jgi:ABC-type glycerol-3-phosphate transport system permease component